MSRLISRWNELVIELWFHLHVEWMFGSLKIVLTSSFLLVESYLMEVASENMSFCYKI